METRWRAGAVSYLNTAPIIARLPELAPQLRLTLDLPSRLAADLHAGDLDVALVPVIELFRGAGRFQMVPEVCIASYGPVMSVLLASRAPFSHIRTVAADVGSRTSVALSKLLLHHLFGVEPEYIPLPLEQHPCQTEADAALVIGDRAMKLRGGTFPYTLDLGYEWSRWTGLPFVFAVWAANVELPAEIVAALVQAKDLGKPLAASIARREARRLGLDPAQCEYYLTQVIRHDLGPAELAGMRRFQQMATAQGLAPEGADVVFQVVDDCAAVAQGG